jgi:hypothetical protein
VDEEELQINKPISGLTIEELLDEKAMIPAYRKWHAEEGRRYFESLDRVSLEPELSENEMLNFKYLQAVYSLNTFYGRHIKPCDNNFETENERICSAIIGWGGTILDMHRAGADALYCALLSDSYTDKAIMVKAVGWYIPF